MLVMTSFAFMFVEVPAPPWMTPDDELVVELPVDHELRGPVDQVGLLGVERADLAVGAGGGLLDHRERRDEVL